MTYMRHNRIGLVVTLIVAVFVLIVASSITIYNLQFDKLGSGVKADKIIVTKSTRKLVLFSDGKPIKSYFIVLGGEPVGKKHFEGDHKTPEGVYKIDGRNDQSRFHLALHVSYPSQVDLQYAKREQRPAGGLIMIHGIQNGWGWIGPLHRMIDWTDGCIAVTYAEIEELWDAIPLGTTIEIKP